MTQSETGAAMKLAKVIRVLTIPPLMALLILTIIYFVDPGVYGGAAPYVWSVVFLTLLPTLAYPLQPLLPHFKDKGRDGQRNLAMVMSVIGYIAGLLYAVIARLPKDVMLIFLTYLFSGVGILVFSKVIGIKASGHACGVAGPVVLIALILGTRAFWGFLILPLVYWASLKTGRHTPSQLVWGTAVPVLAAGVSYLIAF